MFGNDLGMIVMSTYRIFNEFFVSCLDVETSFGADEKVYSCEVRTRTEKLLHQRFAHKPCCSSHEHAAPAEEVLNWTTGDACSTAFSASSFIVIIGPHFDLSLLTLFGQS